MAKDASEKTNDMRVFLDMTSNVLRMAPDGKKQYADYLHHEIDVHIDDTFERFCSLDSLLVQHGEYTQLLNEARLTFVHGFFNACVAMCGITVERILKDMFLSSVLVVKDRTPHQPNLDVEKVLDGIRAKDIADFLKAAGLIDKKLYKSLQSLAELRNDYAHATGKNPVDDAKKAVKLLHEIVDATVSILKHYDFQGGKLVFKKPTKT